MTQDPWLKKKSMYSSQVPKVQAAKKKRRFPLGFLWRAVVRLCTVIGASVLIMSIISAWTLSSVISNLEPKKTSLPSQMVLYMKLDGNLSDLPKEINILDPFAPQGMTMREFVDALDRAKTDNRVKGLYARLDMGGYAIGHIQEMRNAIKKFSTSGKFAYIYAPSYAETGGLGSYYLASAFDEIWMQPMGNISIAGINAESPYLRGALDKIGIEPQFFQRKEYKSAYESVTSYKMSDANREMMNALIGDIASTMLMDISRDRKSTPQNFRALVDQALFTAPEAKRVGLVDHIDYEDILLEKISEKVTGDKAADDMPYITLSEYVAGNIGTPINVVKQVTEFIGPPKPEAYGPQLPKPTAKSSSARPKIALVYAVGAIMDSKETSIKKSSVMVDDGIAAADEVATALLDAADDYSIDAVVLRVDSPGGSPVASETILRAVDKVKKSGKEVIVSMGPTAASGGYWIAAYADRIFVMPSTLTGSIGVLGGKVSAKVLWENLGITWDGVKWGENSSLWSMNQPFSPTESERMNAKLDNVYVNFIARVAKGRNISPEKVEMIARGRVWTGLQAIDRGLADQIGGLDAALDYASMLHGADSRHESDVVLLPKPLTPIEEFVKLLEGQVMAGQVMASMAPWLSAINPAVNDLAVMSRPGVKIHEPIRIR